MDTEISYRTMPHNEDAEKAVLGAILLNANSLQTAMEYVTPADFYHPGHRTLFSAFIAYSDSAPLKSLDTLSIVEFLKGRNQLSECGGIGYISSLTESFNEVCGMAGIAPSDVDVWVPHQANIRIIEMIAHRLGLSKEKTVVTVNLHGNTSAASVPLALDYAVTTGRIARGNTVMLQGVGAGMAWGSVLLRW